MATYTFCSRWQIAALWALITICGGITFADDPPSQGDPVEIWRPPILDTRAWVYGNPAPTSSPNRFALFRMPVGFLSDPVGLDSDDDPTPAEGSLPDNDMTPSRVQVTLGNDNQHFDFRSANDPGGFGYFTIHSQYQLIDNGGTSFCVNLRAVTPAGQDNDGLIQGPTVFSPAMALYQDLGNGSALHGFVSSNVRAGTEWSDQVERHYRYGLAVQSPLTDPTGIMTFGSVHLFVEALGRYQTDSYTYSSSAPGQRPVNPWEVLPGLHWQLHENCWMSGGLIVPLGSSRSENNLWHITCSWKF